MIFLICFGVNRFGAFSLKCISVRFRSVRFRSVRFCGDLFAGYLFVGCVLLVYQKQQRQNSRMSVSPSPYLRHCIGPTEKEVLTFGQKDCINVKSCRNQGYESKQADLLLHGGLRVIRRCFGKSTYDLKAVLF